MNAAVVSRDEIRVRNQFKAQLCPFSFAAIRSVFDGRYESIGCEVGDGSFKEQMRRIESLQVFNPSAQ
jgi:hypothetical protein